MTPFLSTALAVDIALNGGNSDPGWNIEQLIPFAITAVLAIAGIIFFFMLILGGIKWILSGGDKASTESARNQITAALIGLIVVFSAWAIARLLTTLFGINVLNFNISQVGA